MEQKANNGQFMAFLIQTNEGAASAILPLGRSVMLIGRDEDSNLYLEASDISKNHASIFSAGGFYHLKDNGSTNGSIVNGVKVSEHQLVHGDMIQFGPYLFQVDLQNPTPEGSVPMEDSEIKHSGNSYTSSIRLQEIKGAEKSGQLQVVMGGDEPPTPPKPQVELPCSGLLAMMNNEDRKTLAVLGSMRLANPGAIIIQQGHELNELILILSGKLEAHLDGSSEPVGKISEEDWIGELNIFDPSGASCSVVAVSEVSYWAISRSNLEGFLSSNQTSGIQLLVGLANSLGKRLRLTLEGKNRPCKPSPVYPWIIAAAATGIAILGLIGFLNERQNTNFKLAEMSSLIAERDEVINSDREKLEKLNERLAMKADMLASSEATQVIVKKELEVAKKSQFAQSPQEAPAPQEPENSQPAPEETPASSPAPAEIFRSQDLILFPPEIMITKKTQIPLVIDGVSSGSLTLSEGVELLVLGVDDADVFVEVGGASKPIPKSHTNFSEALEEYLANQVTSAPTTLVAKPTPQPLLATPELIAPSILSKDRQPSGPANLEDLSEIVKMVQLLDALAEVQELKKGSKNEISRFVRSQVSRWEDAAGRATEVLARGNAPENYREWLTQIIETSKMFNVARFPLLEGQLRILDKEWIAFQAHEAVKESQ